MAYGRVLLTENDRNMRTLMYDILTEAGYIVTSMIESGLSAEMLSRRFADAAILSPEAGTDGCMRMLTEMGTIPEIPVILVITPEDYELRLEYLNIGADEVFVKPIKTGELLLRLRSLIRRDRSASMRSAPNPARLPVGGISVDMYSYTAEVNGNRISMPSKEIEILHLLVTNPNRVFRRGEIAAQVWGESLVNERTVDSHITRLRQLLGKPAADCIVSVRGVGYKLASPELSHSSIPEQDNI